MGVLVNINSDSVLLYIFYHLLWDVGFIIIQKLRLGEKNSCAPHNWFSLLPKSMSYHVIS